MYSTPPRWTANTVYSPGNVVWHQGCYWKCEKAHTSLARGEGEEETTTGEKGKELDEGGAPHEHSQIWTPVSTTSPPRELLDPTAPPPSYAARPSEEAHSGQVPNPPGYSLSAAFPSASTSSSSSSSNTRSAATAPPSTTARTISSLLSSMFEKKESARSSPSSDGTVTQDEKRGDGHSFFGQTAELLSNTAADSLRYVTMQKETHDSHDVDELRHELKGKRVWKVGGVGMLAYEREGEEEERKKAIWRKFGEEEEGRGKDGWLKAARARTDVYRKDGHSIKPLLQWKLVERGGNLPDDALPIGHEANGAFLYACRAWWNGGLHLGKAGAHLINNASISYGGSEHTLDIYEVLCGPSDPTLLQWRNYTHGEKAMVDGWQPVEGGREKDGTPIFIAKGGYESGVHPGKCLINDDHACIGWGGGELWVRPFQVLAYCSPNRR